MATQQKTPTDLSRALGEVLARVDAGEIPNDTKVIAKAVCDLIPKRTQPPTPVKKIRALRLHNDYDDDLPSTLEDLNGFPSDAVDNLVHKIKGSVHVMTMVFSENLDGLIPNDSIAATLWGIEAQLELLEAVLRKSWRVGLIDVPTANATPLEADS